MAAKTDAHLRQRWLGRLLFLVVLIATLWVGWRLTSILLDAPRTTDAEIDADVLRVSASIPGRIDKLLVQDGQAVQAGDPLFQLDSKTYALEVELAEAELASLEAQLADERRLVEAERSNARSFEEDISRAQANLDLASKTLERVESMAAEGYVSQQTLDEARAAVDDAEVSLKQALDTAAAAQREIQTTDALKAQVRAARSALAIAQDVLDKTTVRAPVDGKIAGLRLTAGEYLQPGVPLFTLIDSNSWHATALFRETDLQHIAPGDPARVFVMIDQGRPIEGRVSAIGWGVVSDDDFSALGDLPYVARTLNWVRVAARFPVRIALEDPPPDLMRIGASAVVIVDGRDLD